jgi:hypothetical protein
MILTSQLEDGSLVDPLACAVFLIVAFIPAGIVQTIWFCSRFSHRLAVPLDFGKTFRGKRIFGANKTLRGFVVMVPATTVSFFLLGLAVSHDPDLASRLWPVGPWGFAVLGLLAGLGFMLGELPNSFLKRQLGVRPGEAGRRWPAATIFFVLDRIDSIVGMLLVIGLAVPIPWQTWLYLALVGPAIHWSFSVVLYWSGVKRRPA